MDEEDEEVPTTLYARPGLVVRQTLLRGAGGKRLPFRGLFTTVDLPAYAFLGYYTGKFYPEEDEQDEGGPSQPPTSHYALHISGCTIIPPSAPGEPISPTSYPLAIMNEPPRHVEANVGVIEWLRAREAVPGIPGSAKVMVAAVHTCRAVAAQEEIYFYYGTCYDRRHYGRKPYNVGVGCKRMNRSHVPAGEVPRTHMEARGVTSVPEGEAYLEL